MLLLLYERQILETEQLQAEKHSASLRPPELLWQCVLLWEGNITEPVAILQHKRTFETAVPFKAHANV
jgi:hypothetical protein